MKEKVRCIGLIILFACAGLMPVQAQKATEKRIVTGFNALCNRSCLDVRFVQGRDFKVLLDMDKEAASCVATEVEKGVLNIYIKGRFVQYADRKYRVVVYAPFIVEARNDGPGSLDLGVLSGITMDVVNSGTGDIVFSYGPYADSEAQAKLYVRNNGDGGVIMDCQVQDLEIENEGTGYVEASGWANTLTVTNTGAGEINASDLAAERASISLDGPGSIFVYVNILTKVYARGGGQVEIYGDTEVIEY